MAQNGYSDQCSVDRLSGLIDLHLHDTENVELKRSWCVRDSKISGRGVFAVRDIEPGEIIFREKPLLIGLTARKDSKLNMCSVCYKDLDEKNYICDRGCSLPICDVCVNSDQHNRECELYRSFEPIESNSVNRHSLRSLTVVRGILLNQNEKDLIYAMQANVDPGYRKELHNAAACFQKFPKKGETIEYLHRIVAVLNTNAFEALNTTAQHQLGLRGLYPLSGIMNHECCPNTCHLFEGNNIMIVKAAKRIPKDSELTTTYTKILWSNMSRRLFLNMTKQFNCMCSRCCDPTEYGSYISALLCRSHNCHGFIIPDNCFSSTSAWRCIKCSLEYSSVQICKLQDFILNIVNSKTSSKSVKDVIAFINEKVPRFCPPSNQFIIELKLHVIWRINKNIDETTNNDIEYKIKYCYDILTILDKLKAGECTMKALLLEEIEKCRLLLEHTK